MGRHSLQIEIAFALMSVVVALAPAYAQPYPSRPIRLIVPSAPGGSPDISSRMFSQEIGRQMGQQLVVDNRSGAGGVIGFEMVAKAPKGIPKDILARLNAEFNIALKSKPVQDTYTAAGVVSVGGTPEQFTEFLHKETEKWGALIRRLRLKG